MTSPSTSPTAFNALRSTTTMPMSGVRYRLKNLGQGKTQRLAFRGAKVVEAQSFQDGEPTGAVHTPAEFKADAKRQKLRVTRG